MATTGEKPGRGTYICNYCGDNVIIDDEEETLPPCPKCYETEFTRE